MGEEVSRIPIQSEEASPVLNVVVTNSGVDSRDLIPKKQYQFENVAIADDALQLKEMFQQFLEGNLELVTTDMSKESEIDGYLHGFRNCVALINLWIDSMYILKK